MRKSMDGMTQHPDSFLGFHEQIRQIAAGKVEKPLRIFDPVRRRAKVTLCGDRAFAGGIGESLAAGLPQLFAQTLGAYPKIELAIVNHSELLAANPQLLASKETRHTDVAKRAQQIRNMLRELAGRGGCSWLRGHVSL